MLNFINWTRIRELGELKILTKTSYFLLLFVPFLVGLWPFILSFLHGNTLPVKHTTEYIELIKVELEKEYTNLNQDYSDRLRKGEIAQFDQLQIDKISKQLKVDLDEKLEELKSGNVVNHVLPNIWALGFLASLFVLLGQLLYQANAPEIIKTFKKNDFISNQKEEYKERPTETMLNNAIELLENSNEFEEIIEKYRKSLQETKRYLTLEEQKIEGVKIEKENKKTQLDLIENFAFKTYENSSHVKKVYSFHSMLFYYSAIGIILYITYDQTKRVFEAAGWNESNFLYFF